MKKSVQAYALVLGIAALLGLLVIYHQGNKVSPASKAFAAEVQLEPTMYDTAGVDVASEFRIKSAAALDMRVVKEKLLIEPSIPFAVKKQEHNDKELLLVPEEPLQANKIYKFTLSLSEETPLKWAFQTKGELKVIATLPRDKATDVPANTGIELVFSHAGFGKLQDYFTISPGVEGSFEVHKKTAVFVPKKLEPATIYTVTVKKGLPLSESSEVLAEDYVFQFETRKDSASQSGQLELNFFKYTNEFTTVEKPLFELGYYVLDKKNSPEADIAVYQYKGAAEYAKALEQREKIPYWAYYSRRTYREDPSPLKQVAKISVPLQSYNEGRFLEFPDPLPAGFYLAEAAVQDSNVQVWFQVTDLGIHAQATGDKTLFWLNDLLKGTPVKSAEIRLLKSGKTASTGDRGLATLDTSPDNSPGIYATITQGGRTAVAAIPFWDYGSLEWENARRIQQLYWKYLYLDRGLYKPEDTVHFWGLVKPRNAGAKGSLKVTAEITKWVGERETAIENKEVKLEESTFTDSFKLPNLAPGYYNLVVKADEQMLVQRGFEVATYSKPAYQLRAEPTKKAIFAGEAANFLIEASFFEGTAAANMPLNYHIAGRSGSVTTDAEGKARLPYTPEYQADGGYPIRQRYMFLSANLPESGEITGEAWLTVLNNDVLIQGSGKALNGTGRVELQLNKLTVDKVNSGQADPWDSDAFKGGAAANHPVKYTIYQEYWEKREAGEYYDFVNKQVQKRYDYIQKELFVAEGRVTTGADGKAAVTFPAEEDKFYRVNLSATDFRGKEAMGQIYVQGPAFNRDYAYQWYNLKGVKPTAKYRAGEEVRLSMKKNEKDLAPRPKGFLFTLAREGILQSQVQDSGVFALDFPEELIPNFWVKGVYFDGRYYHETQEYLALFDEQEKALDIKIKTDKEEYRPGDTVQVAVEVKDREGRPVKARVNLNLVDDALYALREHNSDILHTLYGDLFSSGIRQTLITHQPPSSGLGGAEQGGEGGSERKEFKDAVFFKTLVTDGQGKTTASFQVPDNLTSWRLTCQALTPDLKAADATAKVRVKLPFFVDLVLNTTYLTGDQPVVPVRSYGSKLKEGAGVEYMVKLKGEGEEIQKTLQGHAFTTTYLPLPPLQKGRYELTLTGKTKAGLTDTLTLRFAVVDTMMTQQETKFFLLEEKLKLKGAADSPTVLTFTDYRRSQYLELLWRLAGTAGGRIEQQLARVFGQDLLRKYFPEADPVKKRESADLWSYQTPEGDIAILPYADGDLELSAKIAAIYQEGFDTAALAGYFTKIANDGKESRERGIIALYGLASLGEPVLQEINLLLGQKDLTAKEQLYIILALLELGDQQKALGQLRAVLKTYGEEAGPFLRLNTGQDQDDILEATALAAAAAAGSQLEEQGKLQEYLLGNHTTDILTYLEQLMFLEKALPHLPKEPASFSYILQGKKAKVILKPGESFSLLLTPEKLAGLKFENVQGKVGVTTVYETAFKTPAAVNFEGVKITKAYSSPGKTGGRFKLNELVKVNIGYEFGAKAPDGIYQITDYLPAGLKLVQRPYYRGLNDRYLGYPVEAEGQKVVFMVYGKKSGYFYYYARAINGGEFKAEQAVLQHNRSGKVYNLTKPDKVVIQ